MYNKVKFEIHCRYPKFLRKLSQQRHYYMELKLTEYKRAGPCWTLKMLLVQSRLIKLFSCEHIQTMFYSFSVVDFEWDGSSYSECLFCKVLKKWSVIFSADKIHWKGPCHLPSCLQRSLYFSDMFKSVLSIFWEAWFHGLLCISRKEYRKWRKWQPSRLLWLIVIIKRLFEKVDSVVCLLTVCFSAEISPGWEISESEHNSSAIYRCSWQVRARKLSGPREDQLPQLLLKPWSPG